MSRSNRNEHGGNALDIIALLLVGMPVYWMLTKDDPSTAQHIYRTALILTGTALMFYSVYRRTKN